MTKKPKITPPTPKKLQAKSGELQATPAFTLIELIISMLIFTIFIAIVGTSYLHLTGAQRDANQTRKVYSEARMLMDQLTEEIRLNTIDWECYEDPLDCGRMENPVETLGVTNKAGTKRVRFRKNNTENNLQISRNIKGETGWKGNYGFPDKDTFLSINTKTIEITKLDFHISPAGDPRINYEDASYQYQPQVTIKMEVSAKSPNRPDGRIKFELQTTVSSRVY